MDMLNYDDDCECLKVCVKLGNVGKKCYKGASKFSDTRCREDTRQLLLHREAQVPSRLAKTIWQIERATLWLVAVAGLVIAILALVK
jgi:hypothetical protein